MKELDKRVKKDAAKPPVDLTTKWRKVNIWFLIIQNLLVITKTLFIVFCVAVTLTVSLSFIAYPNLSQFVKQWQNQSQRLDFNQKLITEIASTGWHLSRFIFGWFIFLLILYLVIWLVNSLLLKTRNHVEKAIKISLLQDVTVSTFSGPFNMEEMRYYLPVTSAWRQYMYDNAADKEIKLLKQAGVRVTKLDNNKAHKNQKSLDFISPFYLKNGLILDVTPKAEDLNALANLKPGGYELKRTKDEE